MEMKKMKNFYVNYIFPIAAIFSTFFYIVFYLCNYMNYGLKWWMTGTKTLRHIAFFCCLLVLIRIILDKKSIEMKLILLYAGWIIVSRWAINDLILHQVHVSNWLSVSSCWGIMLCSFLGSCIYLNDKVKKFLIGGIVVFLTGMLGVWAFISIPTALLGRPLVGPQNIFIGTENSIPPLVFISFFRMHRNISATFFVCAMGLALYQAAILKKIMWKIIAFVFLPLSYIAVALQHSRSNYLAFSVVIALIIMIEIREKIINKSRVLQAAVCMMVTIACIVGIYASFSATSDGIVNLSHEVRDELEEGMESISKHSQEEQQRSKEPTNNIPVKEISDERSTIKDSFTLTQRSTAWKAAVQVLKEEPKILLFGQPELKIMDKVNAKIMSPLAHMHNSFMQQLMFLGMPGVLIMVAFLLSLCRKIVLCFLLEKGKKAKALKILSAVMVGLLVYGVFEPIFYPIMAFSTTMFLLMAGLFLGSYEELNKFGTEEN